MRPETAARSGMEFRPDINGLRAWAVVLVMLYHFGVPGFTGGFIGVDVFFVISGFLMTGIILGRQRAGTFGLTDFYLSRARRIVPALAALCLVSLLFGWFWLSALDYRTLGKHALSAIAFVSNFVFSNEAGYFDAASHEKWMLHTWSLSAEWQFYLVYPLLLMAVRRVRPESVGPVIAVTGILSLALSIAIAGTAPGFFLLPGRAWELLAGGLVFVYGDRLPRIPWLGLLLSWSGLLLILLAGTVLADPTRWPGLLALVPVLGTVLVMLANRADFRPIALSPVQALGRWSYSIYLWHWPLFVAARYFDLTRDAGVLAGLLLGSVLLGWLSFRFVEEPVRHTALGRRLRGRSMWAAALMIVVPAAAVSHWRGFPDRLPEAAARIEAEALNKKGIMPKCGWAPEGVGLPECRFGRSDVPPTVAVWGDSHALASMRGIGAAAERHGRAVVLYNENSCPPILGAIRDNPSRTRDCRDFNREVLGRVLGNPAIDTVVFMARWSVYLEGSNEAAAHPWVVFDDVKLSQPELRRDRYAAHLRDTLCQVAASGKQVIAVAPLPEFGVHVPRAMVRSLLRDGEARAPRLPVADYLSRHRTVLAALDAARTQCGVRVLDPRPLFCDASYCDGASEGLPIYFDDDHPGANGNRLLAPLFDRMFAGESDSR